VPKNFDPKYVNLAFEKTDLTLSLKPSELNLRLSCKNFQTINGVFWLWKINLQKAMF